MLMGGHWTCHRNKWEQKKREFGCMQLTFDPMSCELGDNMQTISSAKLVHVTVYYMNLWALGRHMAHERRCYANSHYSSLKKIEVIRTEAYTKPSIYMRMKEGMSYVACLRQKNKMARQIWFWYLHTTHIYGIGIPYHYYLIFGICVARYAVRAVLQPFSLRWYCQKQHAWNAEKKKTNWWQPKEVNQMPQIILNGRDNKMFTKQCVSTLDKSPQQNSRMSGEERGK